MNNKIMVSINELKHGGRYTFYEKRTPLHNDTTYRATFLEIRDIAPKYSYIYLLCNRTNQNIVTIIPLEWISKVECVDDILQGKTILCPDVLTIVDEYL